MVMLFLKFSAPENVRICIPIWASHIIPGVSLEAIAAFVISEPRQSTM